MALVKELHLAHTPPSVAIYAALFRDIKNAAFLRQQLLAGNTDFEYAFVDARMVRIVPIVPSSNDSKC